MNKKVSKKQEFDHFNSIAQEWWLPNGKFRILHQITNLRIKYIINKFANKDIRNLDILDLGCGGGLTCEPLSRLKANVTGIDFVKKNIDVAKEHAKKSKLEIDYIYSDLEKFKIDKKYDLILALEILEHLDDWENAINNIKKNLKPNGKIIFSTINRTNLSRLFAIFIAENILKWIPKNTHSYDKFITPKELKDALTNNNFKIENLTGMNFNPFTNEWKLSPNNYSINYFCTAKIKN